MSTALVVLVAASAVLVATGAAKLLAVAPMRERAAHLGYSVTGFRVVGALELAGVGGLWWGRYGPAPLAVVAAVALLLLMAGAVVSHLRAGDGPSAAVPAVVVAALLVVLLALGVTA